MSHPSKAKGDKYEREAAAFATELFGVPMRRKLGAGRADDAGDLEGIDGLAIQVKAYRNLAEGVRAGLKDSPRNQANAGADLGVAMVRIRGGKWCFVMTPEQFADVVAMHTTTNGHETWTVDRGLI